MSKRSQWTVGANSQLPFDPLLECLKVVARHYEKHTTTESLINGLPLDNHRLTPDIFSRAAKRAELSARIVKKPLHKINQNNGPVILLLKDQQACVLNKVLDNNELDITQAETSKNSHTMSVESLDEQYSGYAIFLAPQYHVDHRSETPQKAKEGHWFWSTIIRAAPRYSEVLVAALLINLFAIAVPLFIMNVYDRVIPNRAFETLWVLSIGILIVIGFEFLMRTLRAYFIDTTAKRIDQQLSAHTFSHVLGLKMMHRPNSTGTLANTIQSFESFREFITSASASVLIDLPFALLFVAIIGMLSPVLALVPLIAIAIILLLSFILQIPMGKLVEQNYQYTAEKQAMLVETLIGAETIKTTRAEGTKQKQWEHITQATATLGIKTRILINLGANIAISTQYLTSTGKKAATFTDLAVKAIRMLVC